MIEGVYKTKRKPILITIITLSILFAAFLIVGIIMLSKGSSIINTMSPIQATIVSQNSNPSTTTVAYRVEGILFENSLNYYSSSNKPGQLITIYYDVANPNNIEYPSIYFLLATVFLSISGCIFIFAAIYFLIAFIKGKQNDKLKDNGLLIRAKIASITLNKYVSVNGYHPWIVNCEYPINGTTYTFKKTIYFDPHEAINEKQLTTCDIYIDENNPKKYFFDTSNLEK